MPDVQKRVKDLRQKRAATKRAAKDKLDVLKANLKAAEREHLAAIDRKIRRAESRLRGQARRDDTRRKILIGAGLLTEARTDPVLRTWLAGKFPAHLRRDRDCALFGLDPSSDAEPLAGFKPKTLPDQSWGAEFSGDTSSLPLVLVGRQIRIIPRRGQAWTATVTEILACDAERVLVRHSGRPES